MSPRKVTAHKAQLPTKLRCFAGCQASTRKYVKNLLDQSLFALPENQQLLLRERVRDPKEFEPVSPLELLVDRDSK